MRPFGLLGVRAVIPFRGLVAKARRFPLRQDPELLPSQRPGADLYQRSRSIAARPAGAQHDGRQSKEHAGFIRAG
jgi:hypothetical protein